MTQEEPKTMNELREPTADECESKALIAENETHVFYACWYPQMGGYVGRAVIEIQKGLDCFNAYVWHDGAFPFDGEDGRAPVLLHHCSAQQFVEFGNAVEGFLAKVASNED